MYKKHKRMQDGGVASTGSEPPIRRTCGTVGGAGRGRPTKLNRFGMPRGQGNSGPKLNRFGMPRGQGNSGQSASTTPPTTPAAPTTPSKFNRPGSAVGGKKQTPAEMRRGFGPMFAIGGPMYPMRGGGLARKGMGVALAKGGAVKKEKGYTEKERKGMRRLFEEHADPYAGDVTGGSSVTPVKKPKKRMAAGGIVGAPARSYRDMRAGAGSGVGRIQKTKIAGRGR